MGGEVLRQLTGCAPTPEECRARGSGSVIASSPAHTTHPAHTWWQSPVDSTG